MQWCSLCNHMPVQLLTKHFRLVPRVYKTLTTVYSKTFELEKLSRLECKMGIHPLWLHACAYIDIAGRQGHMTLTCWHFSYGSRTAHATNAFLVGVAFRLVHKRMYWI